MNEAIRSAAQAVRATTPLVHNITNYVTVNDCANALIACGASPIMSDEAKDVVDITTICGALVLNIGTLNKRSIKSMFKAAARAGELNHPIILDPVGAGASRLRTKTASDLLDEAAVSVVRGNMSEIKALANGATTTRGVDVCPADAVVPENLVEAAAFAKNFAAEAGVVVAITGAIDIVATAKVAYAIYNGSPWQGKITGAGCMLSSMCGAYAAAMPSSPLDATLAAVCLMGLAGQVAEDRMGPQDGNGTFRTYLLDALCSIDPETLAQGARFEEIG
ncbi:MAG: hydroxyethylthiazole kinase [Raoultibacter sp.]